MISNTEFNKRTTFDEIIKSRLGDSLNPPPTPLDLDGEKFKPEEEYHIPDTDDFPEYDKYMNAEVILPRDGERFQSARVVRRATEPDGSAIGTSNNNPILDTRIYEVMFNDGSTQ